MSAQPLAKSPQPGRVAKPEDLSVPEDDCDIGNMRILVAHIVEEWEKLKRSGYLDNASIDDILDLINELQPVFDIADELQEILARRTGGGQAGSHSV
ncbi:hypothetical protein H5P28_06235 [Ruficoccus amylovorans]|uniref:Uncharacterized protein n=1 Tax=Ruficoccus amylovorans TaxID=1804625 RepID=A0A842HBP5_9BACT|nr:hypothetical protein [Ruficoccus amylovorans]MBC2593855.1 hypothetical protein [Ruficoccus amylovorans]